MSIAGRWVNERKSTMELRVSGTELTGTYRTGVGNEQAQGQDYDLSGVIEGDLLSFIVVFRNKNGDASSVTAWTGRHFPEERDENGKTAKEERISTVWCLTHRWTSKEGDDGSLQRIETEDWNHILTNADIFTRAPKA